MNYCSLKYFMRVKILGIFTRFYHFDYNHGIIACLKTKGEQRNEQQLH